MSSANAARARAGRRVLAGAADPRAAAPRRPARWRCWPAPGWTRWRCGCRRIRRALALLRAVGAPVAAPSANRSGPGQPDHAPRMCWTGWTAGSPRCWTAGRARSGVESTVLDLTGGRPVPAAPRRRARAEAIEAVIGPVGRGITPAAAEAARTLRSPGPAGVALRAAPAGAARRRVRSAPTRRCWRSGRRCRARARRSSSARRAT